MFGDGGVVSHTLPERGTVKIGRSEDCAIVVDHDSVSRHHAELALRDAPAIEDLGSLNGTRVGGQALATGEVRTLRDGASVQLGDVVAVLRRLAIAPTRTVDTNTPVPAPGLAATYALIDRAAASDLPVLIIGETGVGKEHLAERLVRESARRGQPFLRINVTTMSPALVGSELFGHERGAFTGADRRKPGLFELASPGTILLDEIGDLALDVQATLLRVLEERAVWPIGATRAVPIDVRFVAATHHDLEARVASGHFRRDLLYRLRGIQIEVPPLRARPGDLDALVPFFVAHAQRQLRLAQPPPISDEAWAALRAHTWPGNVRELRMSCERAVVLCPSGPILPSHLQLTSTSARPLDVPATSTDDSERSRIVRALAQCAGNQTQAAKLLGISRGTLVSRIAEYNLARPRGRR